MRKCVKHIWTRVFILHLIVVILEYKQNIKSSHIQALSNMCHNTTLINIVNVTINWSKSKHKIKIGGIKLKEESKVKLTI